MHHIFKLKQYLLYLLKAQNQFMVHSPFVFSFYNHINKRTNLKKSSKTEQIIRNIFNFSKDFAVYKMDITADISNIIHIIQKPYTIVIIKDIHSTKTNFKVWEKLKNIEVHFISIDFFSLGVLVNNPKIKKKQHYILS